MKRFRLWFLVIVLSGGLMASLVSPALSAPKVLKFSSPYDEVNPMTTSMRWFGSELEKRTNGQYQAKYFYSGTMGKAPDMPDLCKNGVVDFIFSGLGYTPAAFKLSRAFELMYITENPNASGAAFWDMYQNYRPLKEEWEKTGMMVVFPCSVDIMAAQSKDLINSVEGMKGKKIRSYAAVATMIELMGGVPVSLSYTEVYDALSRGVLDGAFGIPSVNVYDSKFWEVAPYTFNPGVGCYGVTYFAMSKKVYDSFPADVKKIVESLRQEGMGHHRDWIAQKEKEVFEQIKGVKGIKIVNWSEEEKEKAKKLCVPKIWEAWLDEVKKDNLPGQELLDMYKSLVLKYEKTYPYKDPFSY